MSNTRYSNTSDYRYDNWYRLPRFPKYVLHWSSNLVYFPSDGPRQVLFPHHSPNGKPYFYLECFDGVFRWYSLARILSHADGKKISPCHALSPEEAKHLVLKPADFGIDRGIRIPSKVSDVK
ncbi:hypothetical protein MHZ93_24285 [Roseomonas sp. ACRSG]|nr:hypothetical protein [Roseomonas sp. ACRSG]